MARLKNNKPLVRHRKVLKNISENVGKGGQKKSVQAILKEAGYSESYARSGHIKETKSWQNLLDGELPDNLLLKTHKGLLGSKDWRARDSALDKAYKLKKRYGRDYVAINPYKELSDEELEECMEDSLVSLLSSIPNEDIGRLVEKSKKSELRE